MHLSFSTATIALIAASTSKAASEATEGENPFLLRKQVSVEVGTKNAHPSSGPTAHAPGEKECELRGPSSPVVAKEGTDGVDVGVLEVRCDPLLQECVPDASSSLGGRCCNRDRTQSQAGERAPRHLQGRTFKCPATCPTDLCECAASTEHGNPDAMDCAAELLSVCSKNQASRCFDKEYLYFYERVYCKFSSCWLEGKSYNVCTCQYYQNYCSLYKGYAGAYPDVAKKCTVAACCKKARGAKQRVRCIPASPHQGLRRQRRRLSRMASSLQDAAGVEKGFLKHTNAARGSE